MKRTLFTRLLFVIIFFLIAVSAAFTQDKKEADSSIDVSAFENSAHHWYDIWAPDNVIEPLKERPKYKNNEIVKIADNILLFQKNNGGWPKNYDMCAILTDEQKEKVIKSKNIFNTTFDNWTTHSHVDYLAKVYSRTKILKYKTACLKGIDFILSAQYPNGGWPQFFPDTSGYAKYITFNDGVMTGVMNLLYNIIQNKPYFSFVNNTIKAEIKEAFNRGLYCILKCQIVENGVPTAWGQQHDNITLKPQWARAYEPPSICSQESSALILFLMSIKNPPKEIVNSIRYAVKWIEQSKIIGIRIETKRIEPVKYKYSTIGVDRYVVNDSTAPPVWTRFYELGTHRPLFCNRDSKVVYSLAEVLHERRAGYGWYTYDPQNVLEAYPAWLKKMTPENN